MTLGFKIKSKSKKVYAKARNRNRNKFSRRGIKMVSKRVLKKGRSRRRVTRKGGFMRGGGPKPKLKRKPTEAAITEAAGEQAARDTAARDTAARDAEAREQAAREQEALEQAVIIENEQMPADETRILTNLANNQNKQISSLTCVNGPDYVELPGYCDFLAYIEGLPVEREERNKGAKIVEEVDKRRGLLRGENGRNVFKNLGPEILINKLIKMVIVLVGENYMILWSYANMLNYNYAEDYFKKWVTNNGNGTFNILQTPKQVVLITRKIIRDIEIKPDITSQLVSKNLLLTRSYYPNIYNNIINQYFSPSYNMENTVFICPIYEIPHSAIANDFNGRQLQMSGEVIPRPLIYAGLEGVFYMKKKKKTRYFVIANLSGHYKTPKNRMPFVAWVLETYYNYTGIRVIPDPLPPSPTSSVSSIDSNSSDAGPREEWRRFITNDPDIITFGQALQKLDLADSTPVDDSSTYGKLFSQGSQGKGSIGSQPN